MKYSFLFSRKRCLLLDFHVKSISFSISPDNGGRQRQSFHPHLMLGFHNFVSYSDGTRAGLFLLSLFTIAVDTEFGNINIFSSWYGRQTLVM